MTASREALVGLEIRMHEVSPLPVRIDPVRRESGLGFLLRAARANGLTLASLLEGLGLPRSPRPTLKGLAVLAHATEVELDWLISRTAVFGKRDGFRCAEWLGRSWACSLSLRGAHPQICPECLREGQACLLEWELTGVVGCLRHRRPLVDGCLHCGRRLNWWRPAIDVCSCGRFLSADSAVAPLDDDVLGWIADLAVGACATDCAAEDVCATSSLPRWLEALSPDGLGAVVFAFGCRTEPLERVASATATVPSSTLRMAQVIRRGVHRIHQAGQLREMCSANLRMLIYEEGLQRLWRRGAIEADRGVAAGLLTWLGAGMPGSRSAARKYGGGQGELFPLGEYP